mgnify:CR=1 FL=1
MKISPYSAVAFALMTGAIFVTSCTNDIEVDKNIDPAGNAISFAPSVGHTSRATETNRDNLGNFAVVARGIHHDGVLYDSFLIGSATAGEVATREGDSYIWNLGRNVYWPSTFNDVMFFAYTTLKSGETGEALYSGSTFGFDSSKNPYIDGYTPKKADVSVSSDDAAMVWADGKEQKDLLVAYTKQARSKSPTTVDLKFKHALTQISITAKQKDKIDSDHRVVKIKGAWIVNAAKTGKLSGNLNYNPEKQSTDDKLSWTTTGTDKVAYGSFYNQILELNKDDDMDLLRPEAAGNLLGSLMLVPEDLTEWGKTQNDNGAYILLLCRVELKHGGATHDGDADMTDILTDGTNHYHQLFPVNTITYNAAQYGFVCVPLKSTWNTNGIGKHYTYKLDICGATTGAGLYPPTLAVDFINKLIPKDSKVGDSALEVVTDRPDGKKVGDAVLDEPIKFSVSVEDWVTPKDSEWKPGNGTF